MSQHPSLAILLGMPRAATTFLYHNLQRHPNIFVPFRRKSNYFSLHCKKGNDWFWSHFKGIREGQVALDTETLGFVDTRISPYEKLDAVDPEAKGILVLRQPDAWAHSLYKQLATFDTSIPSYDDYICGKFTFEEDGSPITFNVKDGDITKRIKAIKKQLSGRLLILDFELVKSDPLKMLQAIEKHLGVPRYFNSDNIEKGKINASDRRHNKFMAKLLRNQYLIGALKILVPRPMVIKLRNIYDKASANGTSRSSIPMAPVNNNPQTSNFPSDAKYMADLFRDKQIISI